MTIKNNVTRLLEQRKIPYTAYELSAEKHSAVETAALLNLPEELIFKTIVLLPAEKGKPILAVIPGPFEVNLKAAAKVLGEKKVVLTTQKEAETLTGLQSGGISPLALLNKGFRVILDLSAQDHQEVHISGGQRGLNIRLAVKDLVSLTNAVFGEISE